jgi:hypothetical protein
MTGIFKGQYTAQIKGSFVVFIIGMRINEFWKFGRWLPVVRAMPAMLKELSARRDLGLLHAQPFLYRRGAALVQYWRTFEQLEQIARDPSLTHLDDWRRFNKAVGADGSVGIWHETYVVREGQYESSYGNMPRMGLASAGEHERVFKSKETASRRMNRYGRASGESCETPRQR